MIGVNPPSAQAESVVVLQSRVPRGEDGADANAVAISNDASNIAGAYGGDGGFPPPQGGDGGDARAIAETRTPGTADARATAVGGEGESFGAGGDAYVEAYAENSSNAPVDVFARAEAGGTGFTRSAEIAPGGRAEIGRAEGISTGGGDVSVIAEIVQGIGNASIVDVARGETTGRLHLEQTIRLRNDDPAVHPGTRDVHNELNQSVDADELSLHLSAIGSPAGDASTLTSRAGDAGGVSVRARGTNQGGSVAIQAGALGGEGGEGFRDSIPGGRGGDAILDLEARTLGDGHAVEIGTASTVSGYQTSARGGNGDRGLGSGTPAAGPGGDASSRSVGIAEADSEVRIVDRAFGGASQGGFGGDATSYAEGRNAGASPVSVRAEATAGAGATPGEAIATARGVSTGGGAVRVEALAQSAALFSGGSSGSIELNDAVSGGTTGLLVLDQTARGAVSRTGRGHATTALSASNELGGDLEAHLRALGGSADIGADLPVGDATITRFDFRGSAARDVALTAEARAGSGLGEESDGGGDASIRSHVVGSNARALSLSAQAFGGTGDDVYGFRGGDGGASDVDLSIETSSETLTVEGLAFAGGGGESTRAEWAAGNGGDATTRIVAINQAGSANVVGAARGAGGGFANRTFNLNAEVTGRGGDADAQVEVRTGGDGGHINLGAPDTFPSTPTGARGGNASRIRSNAPEIAPARGGNARSRSVAIASGAADVWVRDVAEGGDAAGRERGGHASSSARGESEGGNVTVLAEADAGRSGEGVAAPNVSLGEVYGSSTTGDVRVEGRLFAGRGSSNLDAVLVDVVRGETAGELDLYQQAWAGSSSGSVRAGGRAESALRHHGSAERVGITALATGSAGDLGGEARAAIALVNTGGNARAVGSALAGGSNADRGADAIVEIEVEAQGAIEIGTAPRIPFPRDGAVAGGAGGTAEYVGFDGGRATSFSAGTSATGPVTINDYARGGRAREISVFGEVPKTARPGSGGDADSRAVGRSHGIADVTVHAEAVGGIAGSLQRIATQPNESFPIVNGRHGRAHARSTAIGQGSSRAEAIAHSGRGGAAAIAKASAEGSETESIARARGYGRVLEWLEVGSRVAGAGGSSAGITQIASGTELGSTTDAPVDDATRRLQTNAVVDPANEAGLVGLLEGIDLPSENRRALAFLGLSASSEQLSGQFSSRAEILLPRSPAEKLANLEIVLADSHAKGSIESLQISISQGDLTFLSIELPEVASLDDELTGRVFSLADAVHVTSFFQTNVPIIVEFAWTLREKSSLRTGWILTAQVPEPGSSLLLGLGMMFLAVQRAPRDAA